MNWEQSMLDKSRGACGDNKDNENKKNTKNQYEICDKCMCCGYHKFAWPLQNKIIINGKQIQWKRPALGS